MDGAKQTNRKMGSSHRVPPSFFLGGGRGGGENGYQANKKSMVFAGFGRRRPRQVSSARTLYRTMDQARVVRLGSHELYSAHKLESLDERTAMEAHQWRSRRWWVLLPRRRSNRAVILSGCATADQVLFSDWSLTPIVGMMSSNCTLQKNNKKNNKKDKPNPYIAIVVHCNHLLSGRVGETLGSWDDGAQDADADVGGVHPNPASGPDWIGSFREGRGREKLKMARKCPQGAHYTHYQ